MVLTKDLKKYIKSLQYVKFRQKYDKFIAEGPKICNEFIHAGEFEINHIVCTQEYYDDHQQLLSPFSGRTILCNDKELNSISSLKNANKILIVCSQKPNQRFKKHFKNQWAIYCDTIQDPGNMGTIMRIADWFGIAWIVASSDSVDFYNPKIIQSAMGSHNRVSFANLDKDELLELYSDKLIIMDMEGQSIENYNFPEEGILVIGNEGKGVSADLRNASKQWITIVKKGGAESLNASVACGIACQYISLS